MSKQRENHPFISIWFGNFFEPFYSNYEATRKGIAEVASLGFNSINLDSKSWEDFFARYRGEAASQYVAMHEFMMAEAANTAAPSPEPWRSRNRSRITVPTAATSAGLEPESPETMYMLTTDTWRSPPRR